MRTHAGEKPFTCNRCDKAISEKSNNEQTYSCSKCDNAFSSKSCDFTSHMSIPFWNRVHFQNKASMIRSFGI